LPWLEGERHRLAELVAGGRCPHALLIQGLPGIGRRHLALWLATEILGADPSKPIENQGKNDAENEVEAAGDPDFYPVDVLPDKTQITVPQIRELIDSLALTSHGSRGKVAIIYPAEKMNRSAANSLLKTLEEPPGNTTIILICESLRRLPATIVSRCQRIRLPAPPTAVAVDWLAGQTSGADLANMLDFSGGAPLVTLALHEADFAAMANQYAADLKNLEQKTVSPVTVAGRWKKEPELALQWLYWKLARRVRAMLEPTAGKAPADMAVTSGTPLAQNMLRASFQQMTQIRDLRRVISGGINAELNLAGLLMDWYGGLGDGN